MCPPSVKSNFLAFAFHTRTVPSFDDEARRGEVGLLSSENERQQNEGKVGKGVKTHMCIGSHARLVIHFECPLIGSPNCFPVFGSHILTVLSILPVATCLSMPSHSTQRSHPV